MNWLESRVGPNPLRFVEKVQTNGAQSRERRAFTEEELQRLIGVSGLRGIVYRIAARTGIRRGELEQIEWRDVHLDTTQPFIFVRASISKNHRQAMQPLASDAVDALRELRSVDGKPYERVFSGWIPRMEQFRKDLKAADIPSTDGARGIRGFSFIA
jgi:integrase